MSFVFYKGHRAAAGRGRGLRGSDAREGVALATQGRGSKGMGDVSGGLTGGTWRAGKRWSWEEVFPACGLGTRADSDASI